MWLDGSEGKLVRCQAYQFMIRLPRSWVGAISARKTGTTAAFPPMPIPRMLRQMNRLHHFSIKALAIVDANIRHAETRIARRRPTRSSLSGSERMEPLHMLERCKATALELSDLTHTGLKRNGAALTAPYIKAVSGRHCRGAPPVSKLGSIRGSRKHILAPAVETC